MKRRRKGNAAEPSSEGDQWPYRLWCVVRDNYEFIYIYGTAQECRSVVALQPSGTCLCKGGGLSLDDVQARAATAADELQKTYGDIGRVRALSAPNFLLDRTPPRWHFRLR